MPRQKFKPSGNSTNRALSANSTRAQLHLIDFDVIPLAPFFGLEQLSAARS